MTASLVPTRKEGELLLSQGGKLGAYSAVFVSFYLTFLYSLPFELGREVGA
jgi:hypothetical protein